MRHLFFLLFVATIFVAAPEVAAQTPDPTPSQVRRQARLFDEHTVRMGQTAYSIARGYGISLETLAQDNPDIDLTQIRLGQVLLIRKSQQGRTRPNEVVRQWEQMIDEAGGESGREADPDPSAEGQNIQEEMFPSPNDRTWWTTPGSGRGADVPKVAMVLPFDANAGSASGANRDFVDLYRGALIALEDLRSRGNSLDFVLYDSSRSPQKVSETVSSPEFADTDLIIGPVFEDELAAAVRFGEQFRIPVVSPLASDIRSVDSDMLYQMAPDPKVKYDKLRESFRADANIILIYSGAGNDAEFEREMIALLGGGNYGRFTIESRVGVDARTQAEQRGSIASLIDWNRKNIFVVLGATQLAVNDALATISSSYTNVSARSSRRADISVVGSSRWALFPGIDKSLFFSLGVKFVTPYFIDHLNVDVARFENRYLEVYGHLPSRSAFRGYDAVALFAGALFEEGNSVAERLERVDATPIGTPYRFRQQQQQSGGFWNQAPIGRGNHVNDRWTLVEYTRDNSISIR